MSYERIIGTVVVLLMMAILVMCAVGCAPMPPINVNVLCPRPPVEALSPRELLPAVGPLDGANPSEIVGVLSEALRVDEQVLDRSEDKRQELIDFGVSQCGWTR